MSGWSGPADIEAKVRLRWRDGTLLRAHVAQEPCPEIQVPLRGPKVSEIGEALDEVRAWSDRLDHGRRHDTRYALRWTAIGGRHFGRNRIPARAVVSTYEQAWAILGVAAEARRFTEICASAAELEPVRAWILQHPHQALVLGDDWPRLLAAYRWLQAHRDQGKYLREISAPGVDTKFAERHRSTLAALLGVGGTAHGFLSGLGLRQKPELVRVRVSPQLGLPDGLSELALRVEELAHLALTPRTALVIENEITYLSVPVPDHSVVLWGKGFEVDRVGRLPWLQQARVGYWGDLDTHGFAILDRLRAWLPQTRSVLMDRETLLAHRDRWVGEDRPTSARLTRLTTAEHDVYADLVADQFGERVRLEQERIDWTWAEQRLPR